MNAQKVISPNSTFLFNVNSEDCNIRLDTYISKKFVNYSRSFFKKLIDENLVYINGKIINKASYNLKKDDEVLVKFPEANKKDNLKSIIDDLKVDIVFEHSDFIIINKPAGLLVHSANSKDVDVTLVDWLLVKFEEIAQVDSSERPGIVHRLDMNTSGLIIIARNNYAHKTFGDMFKSRKIKKTYLTLVQGQPSNEGLIDYPIVRHPSGNKMTCIKSSLKLPFAKGNIRNAQTNYKVIKNYKDYSLIQANPITGRTHQIRVHLASIGHPVIGDNLYGKKSKLIDRHALHAYKLEFEYEDQKFNFEAPIPHDIKNLLND